jgi:hypothetical protein
MHAGEDLHQRAFAGAVFAHQGMHFAAPQIEIDIPKGDDAGKGFGDSFRRQDDAVGVQRSGCIAQPRRLAQAFGRPGASGSDPHARPTPVLVATPPASGLNRTQMRLH